MCELTIILYFVVGNSDYEVVIEDLNPIEREPYFRAVDRKSAEEILQNRVDGSCLIRPFKEIVSGVQINMLKPNFNKNCFFFCT